MQVRSPCIVPGDLRLTFILNYDSDNNTTKYYFKTTVLAILFCLLLGGFNRPQLCKCGTTSAAFKAFT